jgi:signal transduction histidine kinase
VYLPFQTPSGRKLLYENYVLYDSVQANGRMILLSFVPAVFGTLLVLELVQLSLAWSLARRVQAGLHDRERLLRRAIDASELERRRIARDLHDGTAQDLTAVSLSLEVNSRQLARQGQESAARTLDEAAAETRKSVRQLRTLFVDIYPENLHEQGLEVALRDLLDPFTVRGVATSLDVPPTLPVAPEAERLLYRVAREALRNVAGHSQARSIDVRVIKGGGKVTLTVRDDGRGFDVSRLANPPPGHLGLRLLSDLASDAGGQFHVSSTVGEGTEVRLELPSK